MVKTNLATERVRAKSLKIQALSSDFLSAILLTSSLRMPTKDPTLMGLCPLVNYSIAL